MKTYPLSLAQQQILLSDAAAAHKQLNTLAMLLPLPAGVSCQQVQHAVNALLLAEPALRLRVRLQGAEPVLWQDDALTVTVQAAQAQDEAQAERLLEQASRAPFLLYEQPLCRFTAVTLPQSSAVVVSVHHLLADSYGLRLVCRRLLSLLVQPACAAVPRALCLAAPPDAAASAAALAFWAKHLEGVAAGAAPRPVSANLPETVACHTAVLSGGLSQRLRDFAKQNNCTPYTVFLAAASLYLARVCGSADAVVNVPRLNRPDAAARQAVGMFTLAVPVRVPVCETVSFLQLCQTARSQSAAAAKHRACGYTALLQQLQQRGVSGPLAWFTLSYQGCSPETELPDTVRARFCGAISTLLTLQITEAAPYAPYCLQFEAREAYWQPGEVQALCDSLVFVLEQGLAAPQTSVEKISVTTPPQCAALWAQAHAHTLPYDKTDTLVSLLRKQTALHPGALAAVCADRTYTYAELEADSDAMARGLAAQGVVPGDLVALMLPRTSALLCALFAVMKAGAAYVPIDPEYPAERKRYIFENSGARLLVTDAPQTLTAQTAQTAQLLRAGRTDAPLPAAHAGDLCYVIYTSGTTGKPKGTLIEHGGVVNFIQPDNNAFNRDVVQNGTGIVAVGSICFDISAFEIYVTLLNGVPVVLADEAAMHDPRALAQLITANGANILHCTPSRLLSYLEEETFAAAAQQVQIVLSAGEAFTEPLLRRLRAATAARLYNGYGPTETTIGATIGLIENTIHIGTAIANAQIYVLDARHRLLPRGAMGEICIGGAGVCRGYLGRPELTAQRFVQLGNERVYCTGDLGYFLPDETLAYCGRNDEQVKLRGLRIELKEIESCIEGFAGVQQCAVLVKQVNGHELLCCYYSAAGACEETALAAHAKGFLAGYMVPERYIFCETLPHTVGGKLDRAALAALPVTLDTPYAAPETPAEKSLCAIYGTLLGLDRVSALDSFFSLGGTSLMAARVVALAQKDGLHITYQNLFDAPTPRALAACAAPQQTPESEQAAADKAFTESCRFAGLDALLQKNTAYSPAGAAPLGTVLLTGATGFLGIHVLYELLTATNAVVYAMVRPKGKLTAQRRLAASLFYYFEDNFASLLGTRLFVAEGDITKQPAVQLPEGVRPDTVLNCAADITHFSVGDGIERTNVDGVKNLLALCKQWNARFVQISTMSVGGFVPKAAAQSGTALSESRLLLGQNLSNVYLRTKFLAEVEVLRAAANGLPVKILRVGNLQGRISDGEFQMNRSANGFTKMLRSFVRTGRCSKSHSEMRVNVSPVDAVAKAICLMAAAPQQYTVFHIFDDHDVAMADILQAMADTGHPVQVLENAPFAAWLEEAAQQHSDSDVLDGFLVGVTGGADMVETPCESSFSLAALAAHAFAWPRITPAYLHHYLTGLDELGFFDEDEAL